MKALLEKRARLTNEAQDILRSATDAGRAMTPEESQRFDALVAEVEALKATIEKSQSLDATVQDQQHSRGRLTVPGESRSRGSDELRKYLLGETNLGRDGFKFEMRAQSIGTAAAGGNTVAAEPMAALETAMKEFGGMSSVARAITTSTGADLPIPTFADFNGASIIGENTNVGTGPDLVFGQVILRAWKYSSGLILVPTELIQDASIDVGQVVGEALGNRIARTLNTHFTTGTGTGQPEGITAAATAALTGAALGSVTYAELITLIHSVDAAYRKNAVFMLHDTTLAAIRKIVDDNGRPLFWSDAASLASGVEGTILGYKYVVNNDMPELDDAAKSAILFGDFKAGYVIRNVKDIAIVRLNERYADVGQVAFVGLSRHDGRAINAGGNPVKAFKTAAA